MRNYYNTKLKSLSKILGVLLIIGTWFSVQAQSPSRYALSITNGTYTPLSTSTGATALSSVVGDDVNGNITGLTAFPFAGSSYTNFQANSNGRLVLYTSTAPTTTGTSTPLSSSITNAAAVLAPFGADLVSVPGTNFLYQTIGNELVFQWENYSRFNSSVNDVLNFQIRLNTVTGTVSYVYGTMTQGSSTSNPQIGIRTNTTYPGNVNNLLLNVTGSPATCDWSNVVTGVANNSSVYFNSANPSVAPTSGLTYTWTPQNSVDRVTTFSAASAITSTGATLSWTAPTGATQYNVQYRAVGACSWTNWSGNPVSGTTVSLTGLNVATTYQIRVQSSNGTSAPIYSQIPNQAGSGSGYIAAGTFTTLTEPCAGNPNTPTIATSAVNTCSSLASTFTSTGIAPNGITGLTYQWKVSQTAGGPYTNITGATNGSSYSTSSSQTPGTYYYVLETTCSNSTLTSLSNEIAVTVNGASNTALPANFCGTGGSGTISITPSSAYNNIVWSSLTPSASVTGSGTSASYTASETSNLQATIEFTNGITCNTYISIGVYPLPSAIVTTTANGVCPGTAATINSGLSAGNFSVTPITYLASVAPANAGVIMNNGVAVTPLSGGSLDDGGWAGIPIGFDFNYFGTSFNSIAAGTNGLLMFGTVPGYGTTGGQLGQYTFSGPPYFPNAGNPGNIIALLAADMHMGNSTTGSIKYWTEGYAPNRVFVIEYKNVRGYSSNPNATLQCKLYETLGNVEIHIFEKTFSNDAIVGLQDATKTIGAVAPGRTGTWTVTTPEAWRFSPPSNYTTIWSATDVNGSTQIANGTNIFTQDVSPAITTTYSISYTNQTTGCTNAAGSAQVVMSVLGTVAPTGINSFSSATTTCTGVSFTLSTDYTGSTDGLTFQWQVSTNNGQSFTDITGANTLTYSASQSTASIYRLKVVSCGGTPSYSSTVAVTMLPYTACYCVPTTSSGCTDGDVIARVILNTLDNNSGTGCPSGVGGNGYSNYTTNPSLTTTLLPSTTYNCTVYAGQYSEGYAAWIDYNDDGIFDNTTERIGYSNGIVSGSGTAGVLGSAATFPIVLACTPPSGQHRLRVRAMYNVIGSNVTPCTNNTYGEVEDYLITIAAPPSCPATGSPTTVTTDSYTATVSFPLNCATATNYDFEYGPAGFTQGTGTVISNQAVTISSGTATYTLTGLNALTTYDIYVRANCGTSTSTWSVSTTATTLEPPCSGTPNTATASFVGPDAICNGGTALMTTSGATSGVLQLSNQWEMSTNNVDWTAITGANLQTYQTGTLAAGTYYFRYVSTCLATSQSSTSNAIMLNVYAPPTITVSAPNNGVICGTQTITASGASTYVWSPSSALSSTTGTSVTYTATSNNSITVTGTDVNGCVGTSAPYAITYTAPTAISATSSTANFCGTGGNTTITATSSAPYTYTFTPLAGATVNSSTANTADLTVTATATIRVDGVDANSGCAAQTFVSVGVYPLPSANLTTDVNGICPGTNANINSGLTAGNFTVASIPYAASTAPANAGVLMNNGTATTALAGGSMDDGGWSNIPIGFTFNYFGSNFTTISAGTNGLLMFGTPPGYGTASGQLGQFNFQGPPYFPNAGNPANIIALLAADMNMGNSTTGSVKYWTEGYAPNRVFVIEYYNVRGWSSNPQATVQCKLYETLGNVEVHLFEKTFSNSAIIGLQDATQTIGAVAPGRTGTWTTTTPEGWRFTPPSNYATVWTATNTTGTSTIASGTNIFTQAVSPTETTTYNISYTNQTTGCSNAAGSAQTTIAVLGTVAPSNVNAIASDSSVCSGINFQLSMDYTGSLDGLSFQWQYSTDNGQTFNNLTGATTSVYTTNVTVPTIFRLEKISCGGTPAYTSTVSVTLNAPTDCYCVPTMTYGCSEGDVVAGVKLNTLTNITDTACASGNLGYADYTTDATLTTTLVPSTSYFCTVFAGDFSGNYAAWIDYNDDGVFDASERIGYTTSSVAAGDSVNFPVNISCNPNPGVHRLRVREVYATNGVSIDPCASYSWGETEDYLITLAPAPTCPSPGLVTSSTSTTTTADLAWPLGCATATNYDIEYGPSGFAQGTGTLLANTAVTITGTDASYTLTGLTPNSSYDVYVRANCGGGDVSPWSIGTTVTTSCAPITLNNPGTQTACDSFTLPAITETTPSNNANMTMGYYNNSFGSGTPITGAVTTGQMLYIYASAGACSASASFNVVINHTSSSSSQMTACDSYTWNGTTYTTSGTYTHVTQNAAGCDSTATLNLTINQSSASTINAVACQSYTLNNVNYTTSGTYTQVVQNAVGCDSTITLNLTIGAPDAVTVNHTACDSYTWNGTTYTTGGTYTANLQNIYGCDSIVTLNLTINHSTTSSTTVNNCGAYTWNGQTYSASGTYTYHTTNASGCDSTATLVLTIGNNGSTQTAATCGSFTWSNGVTYTASGTYTQVVPNAAGCDSTITLNLTIYPLPNVTATDNGNGTLTASAGTTYQWINCQTNLPIGGATSQSLTVTQNGNYAVIVGNANNCTDTSNCVVVDYIGLDENSGFSLNVYPNPTDSKVTIAIDGSSNEFDVVVEDMNGRTVAKFNKLIHGNGNYDVNLNNLVTGVYFIKLTNGVEQRTVRVVKQ